MRPWEERECVERNGTRRVVIRLRSRGGEGRSSSEDRLSSSSCEQGRRGALGLFKYPVCRIHQHETKWLYTRGPKNSTRKRAHLGPSNEGECARETQEHSPVAHRHSPRSFVSSLSATPGGPHSWLPGVPPVPPRPRRSINDWPTAPCLNRPGAGDKDEDGATEVLT